MELGLHLRALHEQIGLSTTSVSDSGEHLRLAINWLKRAQDVTGNDGVAHSYHVRSRMWAPAYPETTGYIIPTFYRYAAMTGDTDAAIRARRMADWECAIQLPDGGVLAGALGTSDQPTIFNTGQVLFGWVTAFEAEQDERYRDAAVKAARWLCDMQDSDGCWRTFGSPFTSTQVNAYNTRSAWGLIRVHQITGEARFLSHAVKNLEWAISQCRDNGWIPYNCLTDPRQPFVHTIAYTMRGFLEIGAYTGRGDFIEQAHKTGDALLAALPRNGKLPGRFDADWKPTVRWSCLTGNCQIAINWGRLFQLTNDERYKEGVRTINAFTKSTQKQNGPENEVGGIKGSHPIHGNYHPWQYPNWATKFFADSMMMELCILGTSIRNDISVASSSRDWS